MQEYLVVLAYEKAVAWFALWDGEYQRLQADDEGTLRSEISPGLWLQPAAIWNNDPSLLATLQAGLHSPEHQSFLEKLENQRA